MVASPPAPLSPGSVFHDRYEIVRCIRVLRTGAALLDMGCGAAVPSCEQRFVCYKFSMTSARPKKQRRAGATETFSVSVDPETKRALRALADAAFDGNMSALVTDMAEDARRRMAARAYARRHALGELSEVDVEKMEADIRREVAAAKKRRRPAA